MWKEETEWRWFQWRHWKTLMCILGKVCNTMIQTSGDMKSINSHRVNVKESKKIVKTKFIWHCINILLLKIMNSFFFPITQWVPLGRGSCLYVSFNLYCLMQSLPRGSLPLNKEGGRERESRDGGREGGRKEKRKQGREGREKSEWKKKERKEEQEWKD